MKRVIVTGANGFVGSAVCRELCHQGIETVAVVKGEKADVSNIKDLKGLQIVYCDLADVKNLRKVISCAKEIDVMFHFAWAGCSGMARGDSDMQTGNIRYTCDAVKACNELGCRRFVFPASIMEYEAEAVMKTERIPGKASVYSTAKIAADYMARTLAGEYGIDYVRVVISNIYGPGEKSSRMINTSIRKLLKGEHCAFSSGEQLYDFIYITDAAKIFTRLGEQGKSNKTYYMGNCLRPLKEYLTEMRDVVAPRANIGLGEVDFDGVSLSYEEIDLEAVYEDTGIRPEVIFMQGIRKTAEWIRENG